MGVYKRHIIAGGKASRATEFRIKKQQTAYNFVRTRRKSKRHQDEVKRAGEANSTSDAKVPSEESSGDFMMKMNDKTFPHPRDQSSYSTSAADSSPRKDVPVKADFHSLPEANPILPDDDTIPATKFMETNDDTSSHLRDVGNDSILIADSSPKEGTPQKADSLPEANSLTNGDNSPSATEFKGKDEASEDSFSFAHLNIPMCPCTKSTVGDIIFLVLMLGLTFNWTWESQIALYQGLNTLYNSKKIPIDNKYNLFQIIDRENHSISYHVYCPTCKSYIGQKDMKKESTVKKDMKEGKKDTGKKEKLQCPHCKEESELSESSNFFLSISIESQLKKILEDSDAADLILTHRFQRQKINGDAYEDIYDGEEYQKLFTNNGILSDPYNFSYSFFVDGVPLGKSSKRSLWPIYLTINELPFEERRKYVILAGLYVGANEPSANFFLKPFVNQANKLSEEGFHWTHLNERVKSRVIPLISIADSVARYQMLNMQSYVARYGCTFCYLKSQRTLKGQRYLVSSEKVEERTSDSIKKDLIKLEQKQKETNKAVDHYKGVKGYTPLLNLFYFSLISGFIVDYMHNILLGVIKQHTELLLECGRKNYWQGMKNIGIAHLINAIDNRMKDIRPPTCITRNPRSLSERNLWKASEWRSWLLFYSLPALDGLLKKKYLLHLSMLSKATYLLLQKSISKEQLNEAHNLLLTYVFYYQKYFGETRMTYNIHLLTHITKGIRNWGPMWGHNAFLYEGENRNLLHFYKSPFHVLQQVAKKYLILNSIPSISLNLSVSDSVLNFCENKLHKRVKSHVRLKNCVLLGKGQLPILSPEEQSVLTNGSSFLSYKKIIYNGVRYTALKTSEGKKDDSYFFWGRKGKKLAKLEKILKIRETSTIILLARKIFISENLSWKSDHARVKHIREINDSGKLKALKLEDVRGPAIIMPFRGKSFASSFPYGCLGD